MIEKGKAIYVRPNAQPARAVQHVPPKFTQEEIERKQLQHDDAWLHDRRGKNVTVRFLDGETITGIVLNIRKFHFSIATENGLNIMVYKVGVKYVSIDETESE